ncbi:4-hydroxy-tetrahydrodipicolinate synthase [Corynebacterium sputi]|uniref:4-hydroxy-tetrahydrodipicolinate synthase n=1 Tax=Corynebacterium sputi TaxID=489915 RepID=UPI000479DA3D|nr:4-hydroxy-tetrahydrodipicolinate synthase [Corynebacterium sputi]
MTTGHASTRQSDVLGTVGVAMVTPFNEDGSIDVEAGIRIAGHLADGGVDTLILAGTTGESPTTSVDEKLGLLRAVRAEFGDSLKLVAGAGTYNTAESVELAKQSADAGADALLVVTPYYSKPNQEGLYRHFSTVADATELPVCLYDIPPRSVVPIATETLYRLADHPRIVAVKDAKGDLGAAAGLIENTDLAWYSGDDVLNLPWLSIGATGFISVIGHAAPARLAELRRLYDAGDVEGARRIHASFTPLFNAQGRLGGTAFSKAALNLLGVPAGEPRLPQIAPDDEQMNLLADDLREAGVL